MTNRLTRRRLLTSSGLALAGLGLPQAGHGQGIVFESYREVPAGERPANAMQALQVGPEGYNGKVLGQSFRLKRGAEFAIQFVNESGRSTALHWRGVRLPNAMDGAPPLTQAPVATGKSFLYNFNVPDAGTFWYHAPGDAQDRLHGVLVVDEGQPPEVDQDSVLLLGGTQPPANFPVRQNQRHRLRLINPTNTVITVRIEQHAPRVMAIDGQPAEPFLARGGAIRLGPGNRIDLFVDMALAPGSRAAIETGDGRGSFTPLLHLVYADSPPLRPAPLPEPKPLPANGLPEKMDFRGALKTELPLPIKPPSGNAPLFRIARGRVAMLALPNTGTVAQSVHIHGHSFRLLDRMDDGWKPFWLDTLLVGPGETERIAFVADNPGSWRLGCAALGGAEQTETWFAVG